MKHRARPLFANRTSRRHPLGERPLPWRPRQIGLCERSYFRHHRVTRVGNDHRLIHRNTIHGREPANVNARARPLTYYRKSAPIGDVFRGLPERFAHGKSRRRLGAGSGGGLLPAADKSGPFFEIDPSVKRIAENRKPLHAFLAMSQGKIRVELGDARLQLKKSRHVSGLLIVDAHSAPERHSRSFAHPARPLAVLIFDRSNERRSWRSTSSNVHRSSNRTFAPPNLAARHEAAVRLPLRSRGTRQMMTKKSLGIVDPNGS